MNAPAARFTMAQLITQLVAVVTTTSANLRGWIEVTPTPEAAAMLAAAAMLWRRVVSNPSTPAKFSDLEAHEREAVAYAKQQGWLEEVDHSGDNLDEADIFEEGRRPYACSLSVLNAWAITSEGEAVASAWHEAAEFHAPQLTDAQRAALTSATPAPYRDAHPEAPPPAAPREPRPFEDIDALFRAVADNLALDTDDPIKLSVRVRGRHIRAVLRFPPLSNGSGGACWKYEHQNLPDDTGPAHALRELAGLLPPPVL
jgi:hypothetical protein